MATSKHQVKDLLHNELTDVYDPRELSQIAKFYLEDKWGSRESFNDEEYSEIENDILRFKKYEPLQYIVGKAYFLNRFFAVNQDVLIPRPETEELVDLVLKENNNSIARKTLDIGTGSGCIALSLAEQRPNWAVTGADVSDKALKIAKSNDLTQKVKWLCLDMLRTESWKDLGCFDILVSNPPYIDYSEAETMKKNVLDFEPHLALFVNDPLIFYRKTAVEVAKWTNDCKVYLEINPLFAKEVSQIYNEIGYYDVKLHNDMQNLTRFVTASWISNA